MPNSSNTAYIVSVVKWEVNGNNTRIGLCDGRSFRYEKNAIDRYNSIIECLNLDGYFVEDLDIKPEKMYKGVRATQNVTNNGRKIVRHAVVFIDRNPVWSSR